MSDEAKPSSGFRQRSIVRAVAFGLMLAGLALSLYGQVIEVKSFREGPGTFEDGKERGRERQQARDLKNAAMFLVLAGPVVWLLGSLLLKRRGDRHAV